MTGRSPGRGSGRWVVAAVLGLAGAQALAAEPAGLAVSVAKAERRCAPHRIEVTGFLVPRHVVEVRPERDGLSLAQVLVEPGDVVGAGQVLARLAPPAGTAPGGAAPGGALQGGAVRSPVAGVATRVPAMLGVLTSSAEPLFRITADGNLDLEGTVRAADLDAVKRDQPAVLHVLGVDPVPGRVTGVGAGLDPATQAGAVRLSVDPDGRLRPGAYGRAEVEVGQTCALVVPLSAVLRRGGAAAVQVVRGEEVETRRVVVGALSAAAVEIREGLAEGDVVVARAGAFLRDGDRVRPVTGLPDP